MTLDKTIVELCDEFKQQLSFLYSKRELDQLISLSFNHIMGWNKLDVSMNKQTLLKADECHQFIDIIDRLKTSVVEHVMENAEEYPVLAEVL